MSSSEKVCFHRYRLTVRPDFRGGRSEISKSYINCIPMQLSSEISCTNEDQDLDGRTAFRR